MSIGNPRNGLLKFIIDYINQEGPDKDYRTSRVAIAAIRANIAKGDTPERTVNSYFSQNSTFFEWVSPDTYRLKTKYWTNFQLDACKLDIQAFATQEGLEGSPREQSSIYYERKPKLRAQAIAIHGTTCMVKSCRFNFEMVYGARGKDFIEVHHVTPLSRLGKETVVNPRTDMVVVCSNCHRLIHRDPEHILTIEDVDNLIKERLKV